MPDRFACLACDDGRRASQYTDTVRGCPVCQRQFAIVVDAPVVLMRDRERRLHALPAAVAAVLRDDRRAA